MWLRFYPTISAECFYVSAPSIQPLPRISAYAPAHGAWIQEVENLQLSRFQFVVDKYTLMPVLNDVIQSRGVLSIRYINLRGDCLFLLVMVALEVQ